MLKVTPTKLPEVLIIEPDVFEDDRGWFTESYNKGKLKEAGLEADFVQDNHSVSKQKNVLRGLHFQLEPDAQAKLVRCTAGAILDVAVDLRAGSSTYRKWIKVELSAQNHKQLFIPRGFGHGFVTLTENAEVQYKADNFYSSSSDRSLRFDDPEIGVDWGVTDPILSDKDKNAPLLKDSDVNFKY